VSPLELSSEQVDVGALLPVCVLCVCWPVVLWDCVGCAGEPVQDDRVEKREIRNIKKKISLGFLRFMSGHPCPYLNS